MSASTQNTAASGGAAADAVLDIAVGVLIDDAGRLLVAQRRAGTPGAGYWEFPGGKQEAGEAMIDCLARELTEEIGVRDLRATPLIRFAHSRGPRPVRLHVWRIDGWRSLAQGREGQDLQWRLPSNLEQIRLLPATDVILAALRLPARYLITPSVADLGHTAWHVRLEQALDAGIRLIRLRDHALPDHDYAHMAISVLHKAHAVGARVLIDRDPEMREALGADGLHWPLERLRACGERPLARDLELAVSAHNRDELVAAAALGANFATLSPVRETASHPGRAGLGWRSWTALRGDAALPVYALGGLDGDDIPIARQANAQGVAAIRGFFD